MAMPLAQHRTETGFGAVLRQQRMVSGLTQEELAERSGLSVRAIRNLEIGRTERPQQQSVELLATALGLGEPARTDLLAAARRGAPAPATPTAWPGRCELPPDVPLLVGRDLEAAAVRRILSTGPGPRLALVSGGPGVGKSALLVHVAHQQRARFPDGQVYADLDRPDGHPMTPEAVLGRVLRSLGATDLPASLDERAALLRADLTARRVLLVLDNVATEAQLRPLLIGSSPSAILVASRHQLMALLDGEAVRLGALGTDSALHLLTTLVGPARVHAEPAAARAIAEACSRLPLALRIAAAWLLARPRRVLADLAERLSDEERLLDLLEVADLSVRASIARYDRRLAHADRHLLQRLSLLGPRRFQPADLCQPLATPEAAIADGVDRLLHANLLTAGREPGGAVAYRVDPLVRQHALAQLERAGVTRLRAAR